MTGRCRRAIDILDGVPSLSALTAARRGVAMLGSTMRPDGYHGAYARAGFFEGWYVKLVSADRTARLAVIPGIYLGADGWPGRHDEAFVQVLDGVTGRSWYERYDAADFHAANDRFDVTIGPNRFSERGLTLDLGESGLRGQVQFSTAFDPWPVTLRSPGIMGWYSWVPVMECYHGIVSFGHGLSGALSLDGGALNTNCPLTSCPTSMEVRSPTPPSHRNSDHDTWSWDTLSRAVTASQPRSPHTPQTRIATRFSGRPSVPRRPRRRSTDSGTACNQGRHNTVTWPGPPSTISRMDRPSTTKSRKCVSG